MLVRLPGTPSFPASPRRTRRRGPRSAESLLSRSQARQGRIHTGGVVLRESGIITPSSFDNFTIDLVNIRGFVSHAAELVGHLKFNGSPQLLALNETFLDRSLKVASLPGFTLVSRRDREEGACGGIAVFAADNIASYITLLHHSVSFERSWHAIHADVGPVLFCNWYRPPTCGETASIYAFETEWRALRDDYVGTILVGDLNLHHTHTGSNILRTCQSKARQCSASAVTTGSSNL